MLPFYLVNFGGTLPKITDCYDTKRVNLCVPLGWPQGAPSFSGWTLHLSGAKPVLLAYWCWIMNSQWHYVWNLSKTSSECPVGRIKRRLGFSESVLGMSCLCSLRRGGKKSKFKKWQTPRHLFIPGPCTPPPSLLSYLCCSSRAAQNLTQYIRPGKWNKEVCLQLGLDGDHLLDVFQGLPPLSLWRHGHCFCFFYVLVDTEAGSFDGFDESCRRCSTLNAQNMRCVEKQKGWPLAEWHCLVLPPQKCSVNNTLVKHKTEKCFRVRRSIFH